jgi:hypothetical protein
MNYNIGFNINSQKNDILAKLNNINTAQNKGNFSELFSNRWQAILQQIGQFSDPQSLPIQTQALDDASKANMIQQFATTLNARMDAKNMQADFQAAMSYLA